MSILERLFGKDASQREPTTPQAPVDLNQPVENPGLSAAMAEFARAASDQTEMVLTWQLRQAIFLVPILTDEMQTAPAGEPGVSTIQQGSVLKVLWCTDDTGAELLPLFTDWTAIRGWTDQPVSTLVMPAEEAWRFVLSQEDSAGAVVNPGDQALPLTRSMVEYLQAAPQPA